jgi:hypothetical protein
MDVVKAEYIGKETIHNKLITIEKIIKSSSIKYYSFFLFFSFYNLLNGVFIYRMFSNDHLLIEEEIKMKYEKKYEEWLELQTIKNNEIQVFNDDKHMMNEVMMNEIQFGHSAIIEKLNHKVSCIGICW